MPNTKNYKVQGGDEWVVGGKLTIEEGGSIDGLPDAAASTKGVVKQAANVAAVTPAGAEPTAVETAINDILTALKAAGLMVADSET